MIDPIKEESHLSLYLALSDIRQYILAHYGAYGGISA